VGGFCLAATGRTGCAPSSKAKSRRIRFSTEYRWLANCRLANTNWWSPGLRFTERICSDWNLAVNGKTPFPIEGLDQ
jgi:hypothetical protein